MRNIFVALMIVVACSGMSASAFAQAAPTAVQINDDALLEWTPSIDDASVTSYRAELFLAANVSALHVPTGVPALVIDQGKPVPDGSNTQRGPHIKPFLLPDVSYIAFLRAVGADRQFSVLSNSTDAFISGVQTPPVSSCNHSITISVIDWTRMVAVGARGRLLVQLANAFPIVQLQIRLDTQVIAEVNGAELRDAAGLYFSVPRTPNTYNIFVFAKDSTNCVAQTTAPRTVVVF